MGVLERAGGIRAGHAAWMRVEEIGRRFEMLGDPGDYREARELAERAFRIFDEHHGTGSYDPATAAGGLGWLSLAAADHEAAMQWFREAMRRYRGRGSDGGQLYMIESIMVVAVENGRHLLGARLAGAAAVVREAQGWPMPEWDVDRHEAYLQQIRMALGPEAMKAAMAEGAEWTLDEAAEAAVALEIE